jgi:hypothetical protein
VLHPPPVTIREPQGPAPQRPRDRPAPPGRLTPAGMPVAWSGGRPPAGGRPRPRAGLGRTGGRLVGAAARRPWGAHGARRRQRGWSAVRHGHSLTACQAPECHSILRVSEQQRGPLHPAVDSDVVDLDTARQVALRGRDTTGRSARTSGLPERSRRAGSGSRRRPVAEQQHDESGGFSCQQLRCSDVVTAKATAPRPGRLGPVRTRDGEMVHLHEADTSDDVL